MLNYLWAVMILIGVITGACTGHMQEVSAGFVDASAEAVELAIATAGIVALWTGMLKIAEKAGLLEVINRLLSPAVRFLFPNIPKNHRATSYISVNFTANILGLGWAATPAGLSAMAELAKLEDERRQQNPGGAYRAGVANSEMCTFLVMNISSLQLIPVSIIAYRSQYGSAAPTAIVGPAILATMISTLAGALFCAAASRYDRRKNRGDGRQRLLSGGTNMTALERRFPERGRR